MSTLRRGHLLTDLTPAIVPEEMVDDASDSKPADWDEREKIEDPEAVKPEDWDEDAPPKILDEAAVIPEGGWGDVRARQSVCICACACTCGSLRMRVSEHACVCECAGLRACACLRMRGSVCVNVRVLVALVNP